MKKELRTVVSLFNGMGTLRQALQDLDIKIDKYYSSEIKPYAIELQQHHFPDVIQVGDINNWREWDIDWSKVDFIGSGSPCQDLSVAGKKAGINGSRSSLFFVFVEILEHVKKLNPEVIFLQENVGSAPKLDVGIMSRALGVYPVRINSSLLVAALRDRYYWTNIRTKKTMFDVVVDIPQPKDKKLIFQNIITNGEVDRIKALCILESECKIRVNHESIKRRIIKTKNKFENYVFDNDKYRPLNKKELCLLQGFPGNYCDSISRNHAASLLGDGWTLPVIIHILSFMK